MKQPPAAPVKMMPAYIQLLPSGARPDHSRPTTRPKPPSGISPSSMRFLDTCEAKKLPLMTPMPRMPATFASSIGPPPPVAPGCSSLVRVTRMKLSALEMNQKYVTPKAARRIDRRRKTILRLSKCSSAMPLRQCTSGCAGVFWMHRAANSSPMPKMLMMISGHRADIHGSPVFSYSVPYQMPPAHMPPRMPASMVTCSQPETWPRRRDPASSFITPILAGLSTAACTARKKNPTRQTSREPGTFSIQRASVSQMKHRICITCIQMITLRFEKRSDQ